MNNHIAILTNPLGNEMVRIGFGLDAYRPFFRFDLGRYAVRFAGAYSILPLAAFVLGVCFSVR